MNLDIIAQLVQILKDAPELGAIEVRRGLFGRWSAIRVTKAGHATNAGGAHVAETAPPSAAAQRAPAASGGAVSAPPSHLVEIKSPMVGTFYSAPEPGAEPYVTAPEPGAEPYVKVGSRVSSGQVVCIIEAMKIMNEIESEVTGVIREVLMENAQPVEFGQPLFRVDPHA